LTVVALYATLLFMNNISPLSIYREKHNLTLEDFASQFAADKSTALRWEQRRVPTERVLEIERATGISRHDLRPDIYPRNEVAA
jgi:Putative antitoxin of bacterial toxin-antitoxin system, YdaS/YdaT